MSLRRYALATSCFLVACKQDASVDVCADPGVPFDVGSRTGHADPLGSAAGQARAGRAEAGDLPQTPNGLGLWAPGDYILANSKIAVVIEDADDSDGYDPWGGKPIGFGHVRGGQLVDPSNFGELLTFVFGPSTVVTEHVGVVNDGRDGGPAIVRAEGRIEAIPFIYGLVGGLFTGETGRTWATRFAIDYVLGPDDEFFDVRLRARHADRQNLLWVSPIKLFGIMYAERLTPLQPSGFGFDQSLRQAHPYVAMVDQFGVGYALESPGENLQPLISASGFVGARGTAEMFPRCQEMGDFFHHHSRMYIGGPDADALLDVVNRAKGTATRTISGHVTNSAGAPAAGVRIHVVRTGTSNYYLTRTRTDANGDYTVHVPAAEDVDLYAFSLGEALVGPEHAPPTDSTADFAMPALATLHVDAAVDGSGNPIPYKLQVLPSGGTTIPGPLAGNWGEAMPTSGRLHVRYGLAGQSFDLPLPAGSWKVVASRGFRYEIEESTVTVAAGDSATFTPNLVRSIDTPGVYCADFHIHTARSNDSNDDPTTKLRAGLAEDLDIPVRSDHEYVQDWDQTLTDPVSSGGLDSAAFAVGVTSVELTTMENYGHFGVIPLFEEAGQPNGGAQRWQEYPTMDDLNRPLRTLDPPELFAAVRARPDMPALIVNHPRGSHNYFGFTQYDPITGTAGRPSVFSEEFDAIEVFNDSDWRSQRGTTVEDWFSFLDRGIHMTAVGSSDTHDLSGSPMGYDRTCLDLGVSSLPLQPAARRQFAYLVRDAVLSGDAMATGGVFVDATVGTKGPGETATGLGTMTPVHIRVRAPMHVDVDAIEIVVDGQTYETIDIATDARCMQLGVVRCETDVTIPVGLQFGYVVVAAYGNAPIEPVMRGRIPWGATNAIYLSR